MDIGVAVGAWSPVNPRLCTLMAGAAPSSFPMQVQTTITDTTSYTFSLPNHNHMVALWTDGLAVDFDPGVPTTLTLPGFTDHTVVGVDILRGYEQPMEAEVAGEDLVIRDLMVKDYPTVVKLISTKRTYLPVV